MNEYYIFAVFVAFLGFLLIMFYKKLFGNKKEKEKEEKLFKLYQNIEEMLDSFEKYIKEVKDQFEQEKHNILRLYDKLNKENDKLTPLDNNPVVQRGKTVKDKAANDNIFQVEEINNTVTPVYENERIKQVIKLHEMGFSKEQISKELKISRGEINMILQM